MAHLKLVGIGACVSVVYWVDLVSDKFVGARTYEINLYFTKEN